MATPPHVPTEESREQVRKLASYGLTRDEIADFLGIKRTTVKKYYAEEMRLGDVGGKAAILGNAFRQAMGHPAEFDEDGNLIRPYQPPNPTMTIFLAKTRGGLREAPREVEAKPTKGADGQPDGGTKIVLRFDRDDADV